MITSKLNLDKKLWEELIEYYLFLAEQNEEIPEAFVKHPWVFGVNDQFLMTGSPLSSLATSLSR